MVAMEERRARVISDKFDLRRREADDIQRVLHHPRCRLVADLSHLEGVPVQVDRVRVAALVGYYEPIPLAPLDREQRICVRP